MFIPSELRNRIIFMSFEIGKSELHKELEKKFEKFEKKKKPYYTSPVGYLWYETLYIKDLTFWNGNIIIFLFRYLFENKHFLTEQEFKKYFGILMNQAILRNLEIDEIYYTRQVNSWEFMYQKNKITTLRHTDLNSENRVYFQN